MFFDFSDGGAALVAKLNNTYTSVSTRAVGSQLVIMTVISCITVLAFSFFRPREKKVYAPKNKYLLAEEAPPVISNGFFAWFSPVLHLREEQMIAKVGLDGVTFLRFLRMLRNIFTFMTIGCAVLIGINVAYNLKNVDSGKRNALSLLTIQNVSGHWVWPALGMSYIFCFLVMYMIWRNWQTMVLLRSRWFRSDAYRNKIYSRTLMVTEIRRDFRSDEGLLSLMGQLKVDGIKIGPEIDCTCVGRRLEDFPEMVNEHNQAVQDLEKQLAKYLKGAKLHKRPAMRIGGFLGFGGKKVDAIDHLAKQTKYLRDKIDDKRRAIDSLQRQQRKRKGTRIEGENYGFVTFKNVAEAHRIARAHRGRLKELHGAQLHLAPPPKDIIWENINKEPSAIASRRLFGFIWIAAICFFYTIPLFVVATLANLSALTAFVPFLASWQSSSSFGNWTFSLISGVLPSVISALFGYFLPIILRRISKYQGAATRSRLDRAVSARYFFFVIAANLFVFTLFGTLYAAVATVVSQIEKQESAGSILYNLGEIPHEIQGTYVVQSTYWLTWLPLRGFLVIFELIQLIRLAIVSLRRFIFSHTPREIRDMTKPPYFEYPIVMVNLLWVCAVGMIYAPLAPLVAIGACLVFWFSSVVYKYQLLYIYVSRAESGGRMWNVYCNRLLICCVLMQVMMAPTIGLARGRWLDAVAAAPPIIMLLIFKIYISKTAEQSFRYYTPSPGEVDEERTSEKRTGHAEMEKRFLHPALQQDKLYQIMVHKSQEELARQVLEAYPWFAAKHQHDGVEIKAIREENLEYDPTKAKDKDNWDAKSIASTDMLGGKSELGTPLTQGSPYDWRPTRDDYKHFPVPSDDVYGSTDHLVQPVRPMNHRMPTSDSISEAPLLEHMQPVPVSPGAVPYPPTSYNQPPVGYTPPLRRQPTDGDIGATRWDHGYEGQPIERYGHQDQGYGYYNQPHDPYSSR